jgi:hypothetical protein
VYAVGRSVEADCGFGVRVTPEFYGRL